MPGFSLRRGALATALASVLVVSACSSTATSSHAAHTSTSGAGESGEEQTSSYKPGAAPSPDAGCPVAPVAQATGAARALHPKLVWDAPIAINRFSSPVVGDLNHDGTPDVVVGTGVQFHGGGVAALDGRTGKQLWSHRFSDEAYPTPALVDLNHDGTPDVVIGGRAKDLYALNGRNGNVLWSFVAANAGRATHAAGSIGTATVLRDLDGDGVPDLLFTQSGDTGDLAKRPPGLIHIVSGANGKLLATFTTPDHREIYSVPSVVDTGTGADRRILLVFGTGGESLPGHLVRLTLQPSAADGLAHPHADWSIPTGTVGIVAAPLLVQSSHRSDVFADLYSGWVFRADARTGKVCWRTVELPGVMPTTSAVGRFGGLPAPSVVSKTMGGTSQLQWLDGNTGKVVARDTAGGQSWASPITADLDGDGLDEVIVSIAEHVPQGGFENPSDKSTTRIIIYSGRDRHELWSMNLRGWTSATPLLTTAFGDHYVLLVPHLDRVARIDLDGPIGTAAVSGYRGPHNNGVVTWPPR
jgi:outer membrane protein assembly factor BamB